MTAIAAWLGKSALMQSPIGGFLKAVPRWLWILLAVAALLWLAVHWHKGKVEDLRSASFAAGYAKAIADGKARVAIVNAAGERIAAEERKKADEEIDRNGVRADALRVRGPGAAACVNPGLPAAAGQSQPIDRRTDDPVDRVPGDERERFIALPFGETVDRAEIADANRTEVEAWRAWHKRLTAWWAAAQPKADANLKGEKDGRK